MRKYLLLLFGMALLMAPAQAQLSKRQIGSQRDRYQASGREDYFANSLQLIDLPTASILQGGKISGGLLLFEEGGIMARLSAGISSRMMFGISYSCDHLIGDQIVKWNDAPGVHLAYRSIDESARYPSVVFGLDTQGYGKYWRASDYPDLKQDEINPKEVLYNRYTYKSRGFYAVASKKYRALWTVRLHAGINYSLETSDEDRDPDLFLGMDMQLGRDFALVGEYDFAFNQDETKTWNKSKGYLNGAVRWAFQPNIFLEFAAKDMLADNDGKRNYVRVLRLVYFARATDNYPDQIPRKLSWWERLFGRRDSDQGSRRGY